VALVRALGGGFTPESLGAQSRTPNVEPKHS